MGDVVYKSFKTSIELFFFPFLFPSYCHSVVLRVVSIVSDGCNQSFVFFYVVFESSYRCVNVVFNAPSFLDTYSLSTLSLGCNDLCIVISFLVLWSICLSYSLVHFISRLLLFSFPFSIFFSFEQKNRRKY